jgi:hypothetical protein
VLSKSNKARFTSTPLFKETLSHSPLSARERGMG